LIMIIFHTISKRKLLWKIPKVSFHETEM
jgi:hypothetical protein